eukprot:SM000106S13949  [mRNA]  locus=s106:147857:154836:+ [translate_table: standard]
MKLRCLLLATLLAVMAAQGLANPGSTLINCGGPDFTDVAPYARNWTADSNTFGIPEKSFVSNMTNLVFAGLELYQTAKYTDASVPLSYVFEYVLVEFYFIRLHFAAIQPQSGAFPDPSRALFNVTATYPSPGDGVYITMPLLINYNVTQQASAQLLKREYRLNCGGLIVSSTSDNFYRTWTKNDADFLDPISKSDTVLIEVDAADMTANRSNTTPRRHGHHNTTTPPHLIVTTPIRNTDAPPYYTPLAVAQSDRSLPQNTSILSAQLTYRLPLDDNWNYLVRLIFSENVYSLPNQRVTNVFLDMVFVGEPLLTPRQPVLPQYDIAYLAGKNSAYVVDFVVSLPVGQSEMRLDLGISSKSMWTDVAISGIEILRFASAKAMAPHFLSRPPRDTPAPPSPSPLPPPPSPLAAPPPTSVAPSMPSATPPPQTPPSPTRTSPPPAGTPAPPKGPQGKSSSSAAVIGGVIGGLAVALILATLACYCCIRKRKQDKHSLSESSKPSISRSTPPSLPGKGHKKLPGIETGKQVGREFSLQELVLATNDFADDLLLGVGGFGKVFKGVLEDGTKVAVKRCSPDSRQGIVEFHTEIKLLSQLRHRHLVSLIGYCEEGLEKLLVYDFMLNGVLRSHLYGTDAVLHNVLSWKQRLEICIGAARGLHYLHTGAAQSIIHRDIKSTNILLDDNFVAKVADFGLSRIGPGLGNPIVSTVVAGSVGYLDPEYLCSLQLNEKSDVYSFGVVLLEVICARAPINTKIPDQLTLVQNLMKHNMLEQMPDTKMAGTYQLASMKKVVELALKCVSYDSSDRPPMSDVLWNLEYALLLQEANSAGNESEPTIMVRQDGMWPRFQDNRSTYTQVSYGSVPGPRDPVSMDNSRVSLEDISVIRSLGLGQAGLILNALVDSPNNDGAAPAAGFSILVGWPNLLPLLSFRVAFVQDYEKVVFKQTWQDFLI